MKRRGQNPKTWKPRLSAGGANRTNLQGVMARYQHQQPEQDSLLIHPPPSQRPSGSDLLPTRRINSFQPFQSRLHYPTRSYREWEPPPPPAYVPSSRYSRRERSPEERPTRLVPRKGLFQNAKYSELPPPPEIDEERIRHTEEAIRRIIQKSHQSERFSLNADPNYHLRDSAIRQFYEQEVPQHYRGAPQAYEEPFSAQKRPAYFRRPSQPHPSSSRYPSPHQSSRYYSKHHSRGDDRRRVSYEEEEDDYESDDEEEVFRREEPPRKRSKQHRRREEYEEEEEQEDEPEEPRRRSQKQPRPQKHVEEESSSDEEVNRSNNSKNSKTSRTSRGSKRSKVSKSRPKTPEKSRSPSPIAATGPYIRDTINRTDKLGGFEWKNSIPFMCDERGAALIDRIEAGVKRLPMRDDSQNCYSHIAHMLLTRSMKNMQAPVEQRQLAQPQSHLANSTTSWEHVLHAAAAPRSPCFNDPEEEEPEPETARTSTSLFRDISRLQNPENASTLQIDTSMFANPRLYDIDVGVETDWLNGNCTKKAKERMPPPLHRSSPVSHDVFKSSDEVMTAPSSIKKLSGGLSVSQFQPPGDKDHSDIDDIESDEITGTNFPANPDISFEDPDPVLSFDPLDIESSPKSDGPSHKTMHMNSRYEFTIREKRGEAMPMVERDEQEDEELNREFSRISGSSQRYLF